MSTVSRWAGPFRHFALALKLNVRSPQALTYGYLVPVFFLVAFGSVFRSETPLLFHQMGQLLTITLLGGACFGLPTALVAERERGVWRRFRLLPVGLGSLLAGTLLARLVIIFSSVVLQLGLARLIYQAALPLHPAETALACLLVSFAFLGLGLLVAALANDVPAVQALGQCAFLPMIMVGGVGIPLAALPVGLQRVAGFMPGRYAVDVLQRGFTAPTGLAGAGFSMIALIVIGAAAGGVGLKLFRWDTGQRGRRFAWSGITLALLAWVGVGVAAALTGRLQPVLPEGQDYESVTDEQLNQISYEDLPGDDDFITRLAPPFKDRIAPDDVRELADHLKTWPPGWEENPEQSVRNLLGVAAIADVSIDLREAEISRVVFDELKSRYRRAQLSRLLASVILRPDGGSVVTHAPDLRRRHDPSERIIRERSVLFAKKFLGRLLGKIPD